MMVTYTEVPPREWEAAARDLHASGHTRFGYLDATDDVDRADEITVVLRVLAGATPAHLATRVPRDGGSLGTLEHLWEAAGWSQRKVAEGFGVAFTGAEDARPLHVRPGSPLPEHHLRKDVLLPARQETPWPGAAEDAGRARRRQTAPGVADPAATTAAERVASAYGGRRR